jgi:predicted SprT family Zn-dependent metalloprotease
VLSPSALDVEARAALAAVGRALGIAAWPDVPVSWNRRLRRAGRAVIDHRGKRFRSAEIELSPTYFQVYPEDLAGILVHEAVHVGLALLGRPFGHGAAFRRACAEAGGLLHSRWLPGRVYRYCCPVCRRFHERRRRVADNRWCAGCVAAAETAGLDAYTAARALRLVETAFSGPEAPHAAAQPVCES